MPYLEAVRLERRHGPPNGIEAVLLDREDEAGKRNLQREFSIYGMLMRVWRRGQSQLNG